jgi:RHS repeat-associated protein
MITDSTGNVVWQWDTADPFGNNLPNQDPNGTGNQFAFNLRFDGSPQYYDAETGLFHNGFRDYLSGVGYIQSDPIGLAAGQALTYAYVNGNPLNSIDPYGLWGAIAHKAIIDAAFSGSSPTVLEWIKDGSASVDAPVNQIPGVGNSYEHAMRDPGQSIDDAKAKMCAFIKKNMAEYNAKINGPGLIELQEAYEALGRAMHPIMDSTSPVHRGFQAWHPIDHGMEHGNAHGSLEGIGALTPKLLQETVNLMYDVLNNPDSCPCGG